MVRLTDGPDMTLDVYHGRKATIQQQQQPNIQEFVPTRPCESTVLFSMCKDAVSYVITGQAYFHMMLPRYCLQSKNKLSEL